MKICPNCRKEYDDVFGFCAECGARLNDVRKNITKNNCEKQNKKTRIMLIVSSILFALIVCISIVVVCINNMPKNTIKNGYFLAVPEVNSYDSIDYEYGSDLGFIFTEDTAFTTEHNVFGYTIYKDRIYIENYYQVEQEASTELDGTGIIAHYSVESQDVFEGYYDTKNDCLVLSLTEYGYEFYDDKFDKDIEIVCKHFKDEDEVNLEKMLYFDGWATKGYEYSEQNGGWITTDYEYSVDKHIDKVAESRTFYNNLFRNALKSEDNNIQIYDFYKNYKDFDYSEGNGKITFFNFDKEKWVYKSMFFSLNSFDTITINQNDGVEYQYYYDKEQDCLVNKNNGIKIYRVAKFTDYQE